MKRSLITGQDGSYLAELLLQKNYQVFGLVRFSRTNHYKNLLWEMIEADLKRLK